MLKTVLLVLFLFFASVTQVEAEEYYRLTNNGYWQKVLQEELREPGLDKLLNWVPEEVPRTVSFYFDIDGDGKFDLKIAYSLIEAYPCNKKTNCVSKITDKGDHWLLPAPGINYYVVKKWIVYRYVNDDDWRGEKKTNEWIFEYPLHEDWFKYRFEPLWPDPG